MVAVARVGSIWLKTIALGTAALLDVVTARLGFFFFFLVCISTEEAFKKKIAVINFFYKTTAGKLCLRSFDPEKSGWEQEVNLLVDPLTIWDHTFNYKLPNLNHLIHAPIINTHRSQDNNKNNNDDNVKCSSRVQPCGLPLVTDELTDNQKQLRSSICPQDGTLLISRWG